jgi:esterase/lipase superfamily enzyme
VRFGSSAANRAKVKAIREKKGIRAAIMAARIRQDPDKHVVLLSVSPSLAAQYFAELRNRVRASAGKNLFIFIHGYNVSFEDAARRTAQIHYDLGFDGAPVFYSWPSQGKVGGYVVDEGNIEWTQPNLKSFLSQVASSTDAANIYLIAHSMGNRALTGVISPLLTEMPDLRTRLRQVILTAPDIDADVFRRDIAPKMAAAHVPTTLYVSSRDLALRASKEFHGYPRAGDSTDGVVVVSGIETIDASAVDTSLVGHSYYAEERSVLGDIFYLVRNGFDPNNRFALVAVDDAAGRYWKFKE